MSKAKGSNAERDLLHRFWAAGWAAIRVAGSGSAHYPSPDLLVGNRVRKVAIECKTLASEIKYFTRDEIDDLRAFCERFGAEPWVALRFTRMPWHFLMLDDLRKTAASYVCSREDVKRKGVLLEELTSS